MREYDKPTKIHYLILWTEDPGISLVDKWTEEDRPVKGEDFAKLSSNEKRDKLDISSLESYWTLFNTIVEHIVPKANILLAICNRKRAQQGNLSLEDFYTKVSKLDF